MTDLPGWIEAIATVGAILFSSAFAIAVPIYMRQLEIRRYRLVVAAVVSQAFVFVYRAYRNTHAPPWGEVHNNRESIASIMRSMAEFDFPQAAAPAALMWYNLCEVISDALLVWLTK